MKLAFVPVFLAAMLVAACSEESSWQTAIVVQPDHHVFEVRGRGELVASESVSIVMPSDVRMVFNILWLAPEFSEVEKGEIVARFDASEVSNRRGASSVQMAERQLEIEGFELDSKSERKKIDHELERVDVETDIAQTYVEVDPRLFSQNQITDAISDLEYLQVQDVFYLWQADTHDQRTSAENSRLMAHRQALVSQLSKYDTALELMELQSPANGTFVYATTPWGSKMSRGLPVFPGRPIGFIPIKGKIRARFFVPEVEAIGLAVGQHVRVRIDSDLSREFSATTVSVSAVASAPDRDDPRRFITVEADLEEIDIELMRVGAKLTAFVTTGSFNDAIAIPQQSVFFEQDQAYVYVIDGGQQVMRKIRIGSRSPTLIQVAEGLEAGDRVSITPPV